MKRLGLGKVLLLSALVMGVSGCFGNSDAEIAKVKQEKLPFKEVSSYTYQQFASKLKNTKWTQEIGDENKDGIKPVTVVLTSDYRLKDKSGDTFILQISMKEVKGIKSDGKYVTLNGKVINKIKYDMSYTDGAEQTASYKYEKVLMGESCKGKEGRKEISESRCVRGVEDIFVSILKHN